MKVFKSVLDRFLKAHASTVGKLLFEDSNVMHLFVLCRAPDNLHNLRSQEPLRNLKKCSLKIRQTIWINSVCNRW